MAVLNGQNCTELQAIVAVMTRTCMGVGWNYYEFQLLLAPRSYGMQLWYTTPQSIHQSQTPEVRRATTVNKLSTLRLNLGTTVKQSLPRSELYQSETELSF